MTTTITTNKPFHIDKKRVYEAYKAVKSNAGSAGVDGQTIEQFDADLQNNLYKLWNRMSSGSYFPPPVRAVSIPKKTGGQRILGVPTVADRVAQMVVKLEIRLGFRVRHQRSVRQHRPRTFASGCPEARDVQMGAALHRKMADGANGTR